MKRKRILARYVEDPVQCLVIMAAMTPAGHLLTEVEAYGHAVAWNEEAGSYDEYPFTLEPVDEKYAMLRWSDDPTETRIDLLGRRLVSGEVIVYSENREHSHYRIESIG